MSRLTVCADDAPDRVLLEARDEDGRQMTDRQLRDEAMTLFLAGHETTANALAWTWYLLSQNPEVEAKLHASLPAHPVTFDDLPNLKYAEMVFAESMRLYPPAWATGVKTWSHSSYEESRFPRARS